jgi:hypothetical protein
MSFLADANVLEETDAPVSAICIKELALRRSMTIYSVLVANGWTMGLGSSAKRGRSNGAYRMRS